MDTKTDFPKSETEPLDPLPETRRTDLPRHDSPGFMSNPFSRGSRNRRATYLIMILLVLLLVFLMAQIAGA